jgi:tellurite resistance protein TehA-like permease
MLYIWTIALIFYRYPFFRLLPADLAPPDGINMGAMAISTMGGALLVINSPDAPFLQSLLPFLKGFTVLSWVTGSWWITILVVLAVWRHVYKHFPVRYEPLYWGTVFPLGMYAASTFHMEAALKLPFLKLVPHYFLYLALLARLAAFAASVYTLGGQLVLLARKRNRLEH